LGRRIEYKPSGQGERKQFPIGGTARERYQAQDPVKLRGRRYSPDRRRYIRYLYLAVSFPRKLCFRDFFKETEVPRHQAVFFLRENS
jgi:hypothetical protein